MQLNLPSPTFPEHTSVLMTIACVPTNRSVHPAVWVNVDDKFRWVKSSLHNIYNQTLTSYLRHLGGSQCATGTPPARAGNIPPQ
jgi:hypothetical protein